MSLSAEDRLQHCQEGAWTGTQAAVQGSFPQLKGSLFTLLSSNTCRNSQEVTDTSTLCGKLKESREVTHANYFTMPLAFTYCSMHRLVEGEWKKQTPPPA